MIGSRRHSSYNLLVHSNDYMIIYIGADHRGFELKKELTTFIQNAGYAVTDVGNHEYDEDDDYPDFAKLVAEKVSRDSEGSRGLIICGSGVGVAIVANKFRNVRAALVVSPDQAFDSRNDDAANVLALAANYIRPDVAKQIVATWLETPVSTEPRYERRLKKIFTLEDELYLPER